MMTNDPVLNEIIEFAIRKLKHHYDYCGLAFNDNKAVLNSDNGNGTDFLITFDLKEEEKSEETT